MKLLFSLGLIAGLVLTAKVGTTKPIGIKPASLLLRTECDKGDRTEATYNWDSGRNRWVFVGYRCQDPSP